jgi:hypothetical protein
MLGRIGQGDAQIVDLVAFGAIAHAELNAEIDADAHEQHCERDRDRIERAHHPQSERRRDGQSHENAEEHRQDDFRRLQRQPKDGQHHDDGAERILECMILEGCKLLVLDRDRAGEAQARVVLPFESDIGGRLANCGGGGLARLERAIVDHRADVDEPAQVARRGRLVVHQLPPGKACRLTFERVLDRLGEHGERTHHVVERILLRRYALEGESERLHQAAPRGVAGEHLDQRLRLREATHRLRDLTGGQEQDAVATEEVALAQLLDRGEQSRVGGKLCRQRLGGGGRLLGCGCVDDCQNFAVIVLECVNKGKFSLPPWQIGRD